MIEPYRKEFKNYTFRNFDEYVKSTTICTGKENVRNYIRFFLLNQKNTRIVHSFLRYFLNRKTSLLEKTEVVWSDNARNSCIIVTPNQIQVQGFKNPFEAIEYFEKQAKIIFLCFPLEKKQVVLDPKKMNAAQARKKIRLELLEESKKRREWESKYSMLLYNYTDQLLDRYNDYLFLYEWFEVDTPHG